MAMAPKDAPPVTLRCLPAHPLDLPRGRIVNVYGGFGFLKQLGNDGDGQDIFFRAADVIGGIASTAAFETATSSPLKGINCLEPGSASTECRSLKLDSDLRAASCSLLDYPGHDERFGDQLEETLAFVVLTS